MRNACLLTGVVVIASCVVGSELSAQDKVITDDKPLPDRDRPDQDLTADDFRDRSRDEGGWPMELTLGLLFLLLVVILASLKKRLPR